MMQNKAYIIGLSGPSGSGKGTVGEILSDLGCLVIDCDKVAHENMAKGGIAYDDIVREFGSAILDPNGEIDRRILGGIVFANSEKLLLLNKTTHSYVTKRVLEIIEANTQYNCIVIDAALLYEAGMMQYCDSCWLVDADEKIRLKRVMQRDGIDKKRAAARFKNQRPAPSIHDLFDVIIINEFDSKKELEAVVRQEFARLPLH